MGSRTDGTASSASGFSWQLCATETKGRDVLKILPPKKQISMGELVIAINIENNIIYKDFLYSINKHIATVSVVLLRSGIRLMLVTEHRSKNEVTFIGKTIADAFREFLLSEWRDYSSIIVSKRLDHCMKGILESKYLGIHEL